MNIAEIVAKWRKVELKERSAARNLNKARKNWQGDRSDKIRTLTTLYNKKPIWLMDAHRELAAVVSAAYGGVAALLDAEIPEKLLTLNQGTGGHGRGQGKMSHQSL